MMGRLFAFVITAALVLASVSLAWGHAIGLSRGVYVPTENGVRATLTLARGDVLVWLPMLDQNSDGVLTAEELQKGPFDRAAPDAIHVCAEAPCGATFEGAELTESDGVTFRLHYICSGPPRELELRLLEELPQGHRHVAQLGPFDAVAFRGHEVLPFPASNTPPPKASRSFVAFPRMGIEHILSGYDHILFLFGLVIVVVRIRSLLATVTAFTLAHSASLAVAVLGVWTPSPRWVEPLIALSIAYVGAENLLIRRLSHRALVTFPFGLIHGFGFAGALRELSLPRAAIPGALLGFNVGVELGQLAVLALLVPVLVWARRFPRAHAEGVRASSVAVLVAGASWFLVRVF